jgi:hypothetical protein
MLDVTTGALARCSEDVTQDRPTDTGIVPRDTVETIVRNRDRALELYCLAHQALNTANEAVAGAAGATRDLCPGENRYNHHLSSEKAHWLKPGRVPSREDYMATARKITDTDVWSHLIAITDLEKLMDRKAKDEFSRQLQDDPPEVTVDNVFATLEHFMADAGTIFRRGIANCFSSLDRRFKSHDGFKIGSRVILTHMFDGFGHMNYHRNTEATLIDIDRTFRLLDGKKDCDVYTGIVGALRNDRTGWGARQTETHSDYFKVVGYMNGNAHIWFKRDDLLEKVNKMLAEYYGETIGDGNDRDDGGLFTPKTTLAKHYGFYPTPDEASKTIIDMAGLYREKGMPALRILEPSAGTGNLARRCVRGYGEGHESVSYHARERIASEPNLVDCVEVQANLASDLKAEGIYRKVYAQDFLTLQPVGLYDRVVMNPPFDRERDIDHVMHALNFLADDGVLIAIMSAGTEFRETRKATAFRALMKKMNAHWRDLPAGSFSSVGTNCNTIVLKVSKNGRHFYH